VENAGGADHICAGTFPLRSYRAKQCDGPL
jgi:hypothetical protein